MDEPRRLATGHVVARMSPRDVGRTGDGSGGPSAGNSPAAPSTPRQRTARPAGKASAPKPGASSAPKPRLAAGPDTDATADLDASRLSHVMTTGRLTVGVGERRYGSCLHACAHGSPPAAHRGRRAAAADSWRASSWPRPQPGSGTVPPGRTASFSRAVSRRLCGRVTRAEDRRRVLLPCRPVVTVLPHPTCTRSMLRPARTTHQGIRTGTGMIRIAATIATASSWCGRSRAPMIMIVIARPRRTLFRVPSTSARLTPDGHAAY